MVRTVQQQVQGLAALSESQHKDLQRQLDPLGDMPADVSDLKARVKALEESRAYRSGPLPMVLLGLVGAIVTIVTLVVTLD